MLNPNEAPEGCVAVEYSLGCCQSCSFYDTSSCSIVSCTVGRRKDNTEVFFIKKQVSAEESYKYISVTSDGTITQSNSLQDLHMLSNGAKVRYYKQIEVETTVKEK